MKGRGKYLQIVRENSKDIRKNLLGYLMVRRTRRAIQKYYGKYLKKQGLRFPEVGYPRPIYYEFGKNLDNIFDKTVKLIAQELRYARYKPLLYLKDKSKLKNMQKQAQVNMESATNEKA